MTEHRSQEEIDEEEWRNPANWRLGLVYYSERDSRIWVPKRSLYGRRRFGGTPNFAKQAARQYVMLIVGLLLLIFVVVVALERAGIIGSGVPH